MSRTPILLTITTLALLAPLSEAQQNSVLTVNVPAPTTALNGDATATLQGNLSYVADVTALANVDGVPVRYVVTRAPTWLQAVPQPSDDVIVIGPQPSVTVAATKTFVLTVNVARDAPADAFGTIELTAIASPTAIAAKGAAAKVEIPIHVVNTLVPCDHPAAAAASAPAAVSAPTQPSPDEEVHVQSAAPATAPATAALAIGAFAVAGAGVGLVLRKRF